MKKILLLGFFLISSTIGFAQCPTTDIILATQADVDNFASNYPNCTTLTHNLWIGSIASDITNLNGLAAITSAQDISIRMTQISDFSGLDSLEDILHLSIWVNPGIQNFEGLGSLRSVVLLDSFGNSSLADLTGFDSIETIENLHLFSNTALTDISQLSFLETINSLTINNNSLTSLNGLQNLQTVVEDLLISNEMLENFNELGALQTIGRSLYISNNAEVNDLGVFANINELEELYVIECPNLANFSGLGNIQTITGRLRIGFNDSLTDMSVFSNLISVGDLDIYTNDNLESLAGLENLQEVNNRLFIDSNNSLTSIEAISDLSTSQIDQVVVINNDNLAVCENLFICTVVSDPNVQKSIYDNTTGCDSIQEVETACALSVSDIELIDTVVLYPNPVSEKLFINVSEGIAFEKVIVYSILGERLQVTSEESINMSSFSVGVYFVEVVTDRGSITQKILRE